jgi:hypothetical protein
MSDIVDVFGLVGWWVKVKVIKGDCREERRR